MRRDGRRILDRLERMLDAAGVEDFFAGGDDPGALCALLAEAARGRDGAVYREIRRTARRRAVTPDFVAGRAAMLSAAVAERRRLDLYALLGVPPLAPEAVLRARWSAFERAAAGDADPEAVRRARDAWETLRDPERRARYERFWLRALRPFAGVPPPG